MVKTAYFTDYDFESYMARSERNLKVQFYVFLIDACICLPAGLYLLITDATMGTGARAVFAILLFALVLCVLGLGYCYFSARKIGREYRQMQQEQSPLSMKSTGTGAET